MRICMVDVQPRKMPATSYFYQFLNENQNIDYGVLLVSMFQV